MRPLVRRALAIYVASRAFGAAVVFYAASRQDAGFGDALRVWDGFWYLRIADSGYPSTVAFLSEPADAVIAFFPGFPLLVRAVEMASPLSTVASAYVVVFLCGAAAVATLARLIEAVCDERVALRSVVLFCLFPGAFTLNLLYSEALMVAAVLICFLALREQRWIVAGVAGAVAAFTRPTGIAVTVACAWVAWSAIRERREWSALWAAALPPAGFLAYHAYLWQHTGEARVYFRVQREQFFDELSLGRDLWHNLWHTFDPVATSHRVMLLAALVFIALAGVVLVRSTLPVEMKLYTAAVLVLPVVLTSVGPRPRYVLVAFPLFVGLAARLSRRTFAGLAAASTVALTVLLVVHVQRSPELAPFLYPINPSP